jgi:multicomponent Na+:H+ antiporter subunit E
MHGEKCYLVHKLKTFFFLFVLLTVTWLAFTSSMAVQELTAGIVISIVLSLTLSKGYLELGFPPLEIKRVVFSIIYVLVLFREIVKANLDVASRVIHPKMPIKPGIVAIKTDLKQDMAKFILANSITLTPGTFTLDIIEDTLIIHWIDVQTEDAAERTKIIGERFEKYLRLIFE